MTKVDLRKQRTARLIEQVKASGKVEDVYAQVGHLADLPEAELATARQDLKAELRDLLRFPYLDASIKRVRQARKRTKIEEEGLPCIELTDEPSRDVVDATLVALARHNDPPALFLRGTAPVYLRTTEKGEANLMALDEVVLDEHLSRAANFIKDSPTNGPERVDIPTRLVRRILVHPDAPFPPLDALVEVPVLRPDGSVLDTPGYDAGTALFYHPAPGLSFPAVPEQPEGDDIRQALALIDEAIGDFPFDDQASRANALALLLTPFIRPLLGDGNVPLAGLDAPVAGTGKTLLANVVARVATGRGAATMNVPGTEDEWRKQITAQLLLSATIIVIDNVKGNFSSSPLEQALTTSTWCDRILGFSKQVNLPQRATWIATGNNLKPYGDMIRRCYMIRLDAKSPQPWLIPNPAV